MTGQQQQLQAIVSASPVLAPVLDNWSRLNLPDAWLVAGAVAQTVWNHRFGLPADYGIDDIDIVYFDGDDLSGRAEEAHAARIRSMFSGLAVRLDVKNQARVHLWYEAHFGYRIEPYISAQQAITTFPTTAAAVGIRPGPDGLDICAPFGLSDLLKPVVRANRKQITRDIYERKIARWSALWPELEIVVWDERPAG